ncbi:hypothetical protein OJJOAM_001111 [Cupriavidus sp. H18C1]|uniref:hypothetical protein n=1 Tax=Cupriavidus sp. H18C1 TaxID=3241601 RepID=UPI003BB85E21
MKSRKSLYCIRNLWLGEERGEGATHVGVSIGVNQGPYLTASEEKFCGTAYRQIVSFFERQADEQGGAS